MLSLRPGGLPEMKEKSYLCDTMKERKIRAIAVDEQHCCDDMKEAIDQNWIAIEGLGGVNFYRVRVERPKAKWKRLVFYYCLFCGERIK